MNIKKIRWSKVYESSEEELVEFLRSRNIIGKRIASEESSEKIQQVFETDFSIWCAEGSLVVRVESRKISLQPGDALHLPAEIPYDLVGGFTGYVCYVTKSAA